MKKGDLVTEKWRMWRNIGSLKWAKTDIQC